METLEKSIIIHSPPGKVFAYMDRLGNTGMHMMKNSGMMMGSKLQLEQLSKNATGLDSKFRWHGKMMGLTMDFTVVVTKWVKGREKTWETIGEAKMIILGWYRMHLAVSPQNEATEATLSISYSKPKNAFGKLLSFFLAKPYAKWCLKSMLEDSKRALEAR